MDKQLLERCAKGDRRAQKEVYDLYARAMYSICVRITGNEQDAEDVLQEVFLHAFYNLDQYRGDASFGSWLKRITVNGALNHLRRRKLNALQLTESHEDIEESKPGMDDMEILLQVEQIKAAIQKLPDGYRVILSLYLLEGYDHHEIAVLLSITESTSKSQYHRAKAKLRDLLRK